MLLVSPDDVLVRASMTRTVSGVADVVGSVIEGAGALVSSMLSTPLDRKAVVDYFNYAPLNRSGVLHLSSQFVAASPVPALYLSTDELYSALILSEDGADTGAYHVSLEEASVLLSSTLALSGNFAVAYESGFHVGSDNVALGVPSWLRESVISAALYTLQAQVISHQKSIEQRDYTNTLRKRLYEVLSPYIRPSVGRNYPAQTIYGEPAVLGP